MSALPKLISVNVCTEEATSGIMKRPVVGLVGTYLRDGDLYLSGDLVKNKKFHGGPDRSLCCYSYEYYSRWYNGKNEKDYELGLVGENFTTLGMKDDQVFLGDVYRIGSMKVTVTCNRGPCQTLGKRLGRKDAPKVMLDVLEMGFYLRIVESGQVETGDEFVLLERMDEKNLVAMKDYCKTKYFDFANREMVEKILGCPRLGQDDRTEWNERLEKIKTGES